MPLDFFYYVTPEYGVGNCPAKPLKTATLAKYRTKNNRIHPTEALKFLHLIP